MSSVLEEIKILETDIPSPKDGEASPDSPSSVSPQPSPTSANKPKHDVPADKKADRNKPPAKNSHPNSASPPSHPNTSNDKCKICCIGCFGTRQLVAKVTPDREAYIRTTLIELVVYFFYIVVFCFIVFGSISPVYYYTKVLSDLFIDTPFQDDAKTTFRTSADLKDFWKFAETAMLNGLYWEDWYDDKEIGKPVQTQDQGILYENRLVGSPRLRQIRVKSATCSADHLVRSVKEKCYPEYSRDSEQTGNYHNTNEKGGTAWFYASEEEIGGGFYWGKLALYSGAGAYQLLAEKEAETRRIIQELKENIWVVRSTRIIFLEFTVYNSNINMFCVVKLAWEFSLEGGLVTSWSLRTMRSFHYVSTFDYVIFGAEIIFMVFTLYYTLQELIEFCKLGPKTFLKDPWSYLDLLILLLSYACISFGFYRYFLVNDKIYSLIRMKDEYADFDFLSFWEAQFWNTAAICLFFALIKIFKYISFNATMSQLSTTLRRCAGDIFGFSILFCIVFMAFAQLGYLLFGAQVEGFSSIYSAIFTLLKLILGDFDLAAIESANRVLGPLFFLGYVFFVFFVLLNMFLAIINDTYSEVKTEIESRHSEFQLMDYIKQKLTCKSGPIEAPGSGDDGKITPAELKKHLLKGEFSDPEVDLFLERFELDVNHALDFDETESVIGRLQRGETASGTTQKKRDSNKGLSTNQRDEGKIEQLDQRITTMEGSLTGVLTKMESIIKKMQTDEIG